MDWISVALATFGGVIGAWMATVIVGRWHDRLLVFIAVVVASCAVFSVISEQFVLPHAHRLWGAAQARQSPSREEALTRIDDSALSLWLPGPLTTA